MVEIKLGSSFLPLPFAPALAHPRGGGEVRSDLENSPRFGIYTNENPTFNNPQDGRGQNREVRFCPFPLPSPYLLPRGEGGSVLLNSSRFRICTIENPTFDTPHDGSL